MAQWGTHACVRQRIVAQIGHRSRTPPVTIPYPGLRTHPQRPDRRGVGAGSRCSSTFTPLFLTTSYSSASLPIQQSMYDVYEVVSKRLNVKVIMSWLYVQIDQFNLLNNVTAATLRAPGGGTAMHACTHARRRSSALRVPPLLGTVGRFTRGGGSGRPPARPACMVHA